MTLPWIRFDTALPDNPKILALLEMKEGHRAAFVYCSALAYAGKHGTDGFIPREALNRCNGRQTDALKLVEVGLWRADDDNAGWLINGWADKQESTDETQARRVKAQMAARARWGNRPPAKVQAIK